MKHWIILFVLLLLLTGCGEQQAETLPPTEPPAPTQAATEPTGYYDPDSALEASTEGAVRIYPLNRSDSYGLVPMGSDLLLLSGSEVTTLTRLSGSTLYVSAAANLDCYIDAESPAFQASEKGVTYYDEAKNQLVFLDPGLKEGNRVTLPEEIIGSPALSADRKQLYYCTADNLRCLNLETGLDKLLKEMFFPTQALDSLHCRDSVLECSVVDSYGNRYGLYISAATGETLWESMDDSVTLWTLGETYFAANLDGAYLEYLTGSGEQAPKLLTGPYGASAQPVLNMNGAVLISGEKESVQLNYFDLETGMRSFALQLPGSSSPGHLQGSPEENCIWFLRYDDTYASDVLCRWELSKTATDDTAICLTQRYTYENPDTAGLAACQETAAAISKKHGVEILLWSSAVKCQPEDFYLTAEYQAPLISHWLRKLDQALAQFPGGFLKKAASGTSGGKIRICLVREIIGDLSKGVPEYAESTQFWDSSRNAYAAVILDEGMEQNLYHELFHIIDNRVLSTCSAYDSWSKLNPKGFQYSLSYTEYPDDIDPLLEGDKRAFIDLYAATFPREDRARIMEYAMTAGHEEYFRSAAMQAKLKQLCLGIREAFGLEKSSEAFLWEQYLKK